MGQSSHQRHDHRVPLCITITCTELPRNTVHFGQVHLLLRQNVQPQNKGSIFAALVRTPVSRHEALAAGANEYEWWLLAVDHTNVGSHASQIEERQPRSIEYAQKEGRLRARAVLNVLVSRSLTRIAPCTSQFWIKLKDGQDEEACRLIESIRNSGGDGEHSPQASPRATASSTKDATVPSGAIGISVGTGGSGGGGGSGGTPSAVSTSSSSSASGTPTATAPAPQSAASLELMPADWELILQGSKTYVLAEGRR